MKRQFTATAIIIDSHQRTLLMWHRKYGKWMPPGGHMDPDEIPEEAALRECKEETGLDVEIVSQQQSDVYEHNESEGRMLKMPLLFLLENIPENPLKGEPAHQHIDFVYLARPIDEDQVLSLQEAEGGDLRWFSAQDIEALQPDTEVYANVKTTLLSLLKP